MTKNKQIINWVLYCIFLIISVVLFILVNNNMTLAILIVTSSIPILSLLYLLIIKFILRIKVGFHSEFDIKEEKHVIIELNKRYFLIFIKYSLYSNCLNIDDKKEIYDGEELVNFNKDFKISLKLINLGKYEIGVNKIYIHDIFGLFLFRIKCDYSGSLLVTKDFNKSYKKMDNLDLNNEHFNIVTSYKFDNEYNEFKKYSIGDPINLINWKVSLKNDDVFVKVKTNGINYNLIVILDTNSIECENYNDYLNKFIGVILNLVEKNIYFSIGFYSINLNNFIEIEVDNINDVIKKVYDNLYVKKVNFNILNYYKSNSSVVKNIFYISNEDIMEIGVSVIRV